MNEEYGVKLRLDTKDFKKGIKEADKLVTNLKKSTSNEVEIEIKVEESELRKTQKEIEKIESNIARLKNNIEKLSPLKGYDTATKNFRQQLEKEMNKLAELQLKTSKLDLSKSLEEATRNVKITSGDQETFIKVKDTLEDINKEAKEFTNHLDTHDFSDVKISFGPSLEEETKQIEKMAEAWEEEKRIVRESVENLDYVNPPKDYVSVFEVTEQKIKDLKNEIKDFDLSQLYDKYEQLKKELNDIIDKMSELTGKEGEKSLHLGYGEITALGEEGSKQYYNAFGEYYDTLRLIEELENNIINKGGQVNDTLGDMGTKINEIDDTNRGNASGIFAGFGKSINDLNSGLDRLIGKVKKFFSSFKNTGNGFNKIVKDGVNNLKRFTGGLIGVYSSYRILTRAISAYMSYDEDFSKRIQQTWAGLGSFFAPVLEMIVTLFQKLLTYANAVVKIFTGIDFVANANAKALNKQAKALNNNLTPMDEITNLQKNNSGSDLNLIGLADVDTGRLNKVRNFAEKIKTLFQERNFYGIGKTIAEAINNGLHSINWDKIKITAKEIAIGIAQLLNGFIENTEWETLGRTLMNGINTALLFVYNFFKELNGGAIGTAIADFINGIVREWDPELVADAISEVVLKILDIFIGFLSNISAKDLGKKIGETLRKIKWGEIWAKLKEAIGLAFKDMDDLLEGIFGRETANKIEALIITIGIFAGAIKTLSIAMGIFNAVTTLSNPILLAIVGVVMILTGVFMELENQGFDVGEALKRTFNDIKTSFKDMVNIIITCLNVLIRGINASSTPIRGIIWGIGKLAGKDWNMGDVKIPEIPRLRVGTDNVLEEGLAYLHKGEQVVPANVEGGGFSNDSSVTNNLLATLITKVDDLAQRPNIFEVDGKEFAKGTYSYYQDEERRQGRTATVQ